jgi:hypothetical protein
MKITLHLTRKNFLTVIAGICVVGLAVIPLSVPADHLGWTRWQGAIVVLAGIRRVAHPMAFIRSVGYPVQASLGRFFLAQFPYSQ